jgi:hypothetical protein
MLFEFGVEPNLITTWKDFRYFVEGFGVPNGRLISRFPLRWKRMVYDAIPRATGDVERKKIEEGLVGIDNKLMKSGRAYEPAQDWLSNAEGSHAITPFRAVLSTTNPRNQAFILQGDNVKDSNPLWKVPTRDVVNRDANHMASKVAQLLRLSNRVVFIDPHFDSRELRFRRPLLAFVEAAKRSDGSYPTTIELRSGTPGTPMWFEGLCRANLPNWIPVGIDIAITILEEQAGGEKLHNRYILTDIGGVKFGIGLDEGDPGQTDDIDLLDENQYQQRWQQYCSPAPAFTTHPSFTIRGIYR